MTILVTERTTTVIPNTLAALAMISFLCGSVAAGEPKLSAEQLFAPDHIVDVQIELAKDDWDKVRLQTRSISRYLVKNPPESPFRYQKANITVDGVRIENVAVRKKGFFGSLDNDRPSLKVRFDKYVDQSPIRGLDRLTLNNNKQDISCLSQYLSYRFFNQTEQPPVVLTLPKSQSTANIWASIPT